MEPNTSSVASMNTAPTMATEPMASPSRPSVILTALELPLMTTTAKRIHSKERFITVPKNEN